MTTQGNNAQLYRLEKESELRLIVRNQSSEVSLELLDGNAEIFGAKLILNKIYIFSSFCSVGVFTWYGCRLRLIGEVDIAYVVNEVPEFYRLHERFEELRNHAENENIKGPVTMVVGPTDVGKTTLCLGLINCAVRSNRHPLFIDLDVGQSSLSLPGTIGILPVEKQSDILEGFDEKALSVYFLGHKCPDHNIQLYFLLIKKMGETLQMRLNYANKITCASGVIINTCGWINGKGYDSILHAAKAFNVSMLLVVENDALYSDLQRDMPSYVKVMFVNKAGGAVRRSKSLRMRNRETQVKNYFYGTLNSLKPYSFKVKFSDIQVFKVSSFSTCLDLHELNAKDLSVMPVNIGLNLLYQVLGLSYAEKAEDITDTSVLGFISFIKVDTDNKIVTVLSPKPAPLPTKFLLLGDIMLTIT